MPEIGEIVDVDPFSAGAAPSSGGGPQIGDVVDFDPFAPQTNIWGEIGEVGRGIPAGAVQAAGTALRGLAANQPTQRYASYLDEIEHGVRYRTREREGRLPITDDTAYTDILQRIADDPGMFQSQQLWLRHAIEGVRSGNLDALATARSKLPPEAVQERELWKAGEVVSEFAEETFPAKPGYEDTLGRAVGEGLGSLGAGLVTAVVPGVGSGLSTAFFTAMGSGEAADRAVAAGATDEQIIEAAGLGAGAGATDILPAEMLLGRIPGANVIANAVKRYGGKRAMQALGRISNQAIVESVQEGGQQTLQNLIAREVYAPEQQILEGVVENAGIGGIVGGIAGLGREGVYQLSTRRSGSARGDRSRAVREVPPPSPADEASPIPTADIIEGRERIADAEATDNANKYLEVAGLPQIGQPVRVARGRDVIEGVVSDAWEGDDPGLTVRGVDGTETDLSLAQMQAMGAALTGLPMPAPRAEIAKKADEIAQDAQRVREDLARAEEEAAAAAVAEQRGGVEPGRRREIDQIMADVRQDARRRAAEPERPARPPADLPRLTRDQSEEVARLITSGMPAAQAVAQVQRGAPSGTAPVDETATGFGERPPPQPPPSYGEPVVRPEDTAQGFGDRPPPRPPTVFGEPVVDPGPTAAGFGDRPAPRPPAEFGQPVISTEGTQTGFGDVARDPRAGTGPRDRPSVTGPAGRPEPDAGPQTRPTIEGAAEWARTQGPQTRAAVEGVAAWARTQGPEARQVLDGVAEWAATRGPEGRAALAGIAEWAGTTGPQDRLTLEGAAEWARTQGPETRSAVEGIVSWARSQGPETRAAIEGVAEWVRTGGPQARQALEGVAEWATTQGPAGRPRAERGPEWARTQGPERRAPVIGPAGRPEPDTGPERRGAVVGPLGRPEEDAGPTTRPRVGERERWLQQAVAEATGRDFNEARGLAEAVSRATGGEINEARGLAEDVFRATGRDMDRSRALAQAISEATGQDVNQARALAQSVAEATGRDFDERRALAQDIAGATGRDIDQARAIAEWVSDATGGDVDSRRALAEAIHDASGRDITPRRALAEAVAAATGRDVDARRALAQAIAESSGRDIPRERAEALAADDRRQTLTFQALPRKPSASELNQAAQDEGVPAETAAQVADQVSDALRGPEDTAPTVDMVTREVARTGLPEDFAERIARKVAERQGMLPERIERRDIAPPEIPERREFREAEQREVPPGIPEGQRERVEERGAEARERASEARARAEPLPSPQEREVTRPAGLPDDFAQRIAERVASAPEARGLPEGFADRIAERVAAIPDLPSLDTMDLAGRVADMPELEGIPQDVRNRMAARTAVEASRGIPQDVRQRMVEGAAAPRPEAPRIGEREQPERAALPEPLPPTQEREAARPPGLPEGFAERIAERVAAMPEVKRLPEGARARLTARLEEVVERPDTQLEDAAAFDERVQATLEERVRAIPEVRTLPPPARDRVVAEVRNITPPSPPGGPPGEAIAAAEEATETAPSEAQKTAGNYRKGKFTLHGMEVSVETPKGAERTGVGKDGKPWSVRMPATYGYIRRTEGADGEQVDVYVGPEPESDQVFVVDQVDADTQAFDEHKVMIGYPTPEVASADYDAAFDDGRGPERRQAMTPMSVRGFKRWLEEGDTTRPVAPAESEALPPASTEVERAEGEAELSRAAPPPPIMRKDGSPFQTRQGAVLAARNKKIEAEPVEVEGGWALQQAMPAAPAPVEGQEPVETGRQAPLPATDDTQERVAEGERQTAEAADQEGAPDEVVVLEGQEAMFQQPQVDPEVARVEADLRRRQVEVFLQRRRMTPAATQALGMAMAQSAREANPELTDAAAKALAEDAILDVGDKGVAQSWNDDSRPEYRAALSVALEEGVSNDRLDAVVTEVEPGSGRGATDADTRLRAKMALRQIQGREIVNRRRDVPIVVRRAGVDKISSGTLSPELADVIPALPELIEEAVEAGRALEDRKTARGGERGLRFRRFYSAAQRGDRLLRVEMAVREHANGLSLYDVQVKEMEPSGGESRQDVTIEAGRTAEVGDRGGSDSSLSGSRQPSAAALAESQHTGRSVVSIQKLLWTVEGRTEGRPQWQQPDAAPRPAQQQDAPAPRVRIRLNRRYDEAREGVRGDLERIGRETFGNQFRFEIAESITPPEGGQVQGAFDPANRVAYIALRADEAGMTGSLYHEGIHYLRSAGAFDKADGTPNAAWRTLEAEARRTWRDQYDIHERYMGDFWMLDFDTRERMLNEEAIAEALADYATRGRETGFGPTVRMALNRILRFFRAMREGLRGRGFQTWEDVFEADIGRGRAGERADAAQAPSRAELDRQLQTAWHGSPHRFDEFSTESIGTGEGAQVYGWGLYFADKEGVADFYREGLTKHDVKFSALTDEQNTLLSPFVKREIQDYGERRLAELIDDYRGAVDRYEAGGLNNDAARVRDIVAALETLRGGRWRERDRSGAKYKVDLAPKDRDYLYWDRRLDLQSKKVRKAMNAVWARQHPGETMNRGEHGGEAYDMLARELGSQQAASEALLAEGVRGIKYLDQASRPMVGVAGRARMPLRETFNYVIFDDSDVAIQEIMLQRAPAPTSREFRQWFGRSQAVDEQGAPARVFHGTAKDFATFEGGRAEGMWFSSSPEVAGVFATTYGPERGGDAVYPAYLKMENPLEVDAEGRRWSRARREAGVWQDTDEVVADAKAAGHDGVIIRNVIESNVPDMRPSDTYVVFRPEDVKSAVGNRGTFDLESPNILFQRGAKEDPKAFDKEASDWSGVDLTGAAEEVVKDKDRMGGFAEEVKAGLKGTTAVQDPRVQVTEEKTHKDLNLAWRFLAPPLAWSKKYPAIHSLIKQGVETEKSMSNRIQRLNRDWDRITKPLNKDEFAQLTGIMFLGDAEQVTFTDEQLERFNTTEKVRDAYKGSRKFLDKLGRFTEQHERAMALPLLTRRTTLVRQMAGERGMDKAEFRALYNARAELLGKQRRGEGHPQALEFEIAEATEALFGKPEAPSDLFEDRLKEADRLETRIADTKVRRREGYVPHKFFGRWRIFQAAQPDDEIEPYMGRGGTGFKDRKAAEKVAEASEGGILEGATPVQVDGKWGLEPKWKEVAGEHGLWKTRTDAVRAASHMARENPDAAEIRVVPVEFEFPHDSATTLGDAAYFTFRSKVEELTGLSGEALQEFVTGVARRPFRRRIAGFLQYRTGMTGYSLDLDRVMRTHVGETVRYISLDRLKFDAINTMEKEGLSAYRSSIQDRPVLAAAVQAWFRDVNGQKQTLEGQIDNVLNKSWVTPLRAGLAAGALGFLASGGPFNAPISPIVGAYVGYRVGRGLAQGGDFKTRAITGAMLGDMAHLKLGAVFNLMSALVNTSQVPLNTLPVLGVRDTTEGMIRYQKAVLSKLRGKPNADWRFLERMDINPLDTFAEGTRHKFQKEPMLSKVSMVFFTTAEGFNRGVTALGAMNKAQRKGWSHKRAKDFANETLDRTQFHYGASDKPELLRNVLLRVPLQFKNFVAHQLSFVFGLNRKELPLFLLSMALTAGALGIPGLDFVDTLTDWLFDVSPIAMMKEAALDAAVEGELEGGIATFLTRGVPGLAGVDMTGRVGMGDKFLPMQFRDWKGPWISTVENAVRHGREEAHWTHQMRNLSPGLGNPLVVLDAWENGGQVRSPWKRNRPEYIATETELIQKLAGARPIREARLQDLRDTERRAIERYRTDTRRYVDRIVAALDRGDRDAARAVMQEALDAGIPISSATIRRGVQDYGTQRALREFDRLPRTMKPEGMGRRQAIERMAQ